MTNKRRTWQSRGPKDVRDAEGAIIALGVDPTFAHNQAYTENILLIGNIEKQMERLERRRRQLLVDYSHLNTDGKINRTRSLGAIDDAEIVADLENMPANVRLNQPAKETRSRHRSTDMLKDANAQPKMPGATASP